MNKNNQIAMLLLSSSSLLLFGSLDTEGSIVQDFTKGIMMGMGVVLVCALLWTLGKRKKNVNI